MRCTHYWLEEKPKQGNLIQFIGAAQQKTELV